MIHSASRIWHVGVLLGHMQFFWVYDWLYEFCIYSNNSIDAVYAFVCLCVYVSRCSSWTNNVDSRGCMSEGYGQEAPDKAKSSYLLTGGPLRIRLRPYTFLFLTSLTFFPSSPPSPCPLKTHNSLSLSLSRSHRYCLLRQSLIPSAEPRRHAIRARTCELVKFVYYKSYSNQSSPSPWQ